MPIPVFNRSSSGGGGMRNPIYNEHDPGFMIHMSEYGENGSYVHRTDSPCKSI